jgi:alkanesulfonate monooxygenase SsuD/methylene tetrahydromethanopterin reductase-like flavin-dependent oxidoreductase (luciferase family)
VISRGRVSYVFGLGYRPEEYEHFGVDIRTRGRVADTKLGLLRSLLTGDAVAYDGRRIKLTPAPDTGRIGDDVGRG